MIELQIGSNEAGQRLDRFLKKYLNNAPLSAIYKVLRKDVKVNGKREKENYMLQEGDSLALFIADAQLSAWTVKKKTHHAKKQFTVLYEDDNILAVSKPFGVLVHGDREEKKDTLANQVIDYLIETGAYNPRIEKSFTPSPAHRLDRNTTGIVLFGKNAAALRALAEMMREETAVTKYYYAIVEGYFDKKLHLKNKLLKDEARNIVRVLPLEDERGKYIETIAYPEISSKKYSLVKVELITGRSHQIRAHMAWAGFPLAGDTKYRGKPLPAGCRPEGQPNTQLLHAAGVRFAAAPAPLSYLEGREILCPLPQSWKPIEYELFGKEI